MSNQFKDNPPKYTFIERCGNTTKIDIIQTSNMNDIFVTTIEFLKHCGFSEELLQQCWEDMKNGIY